MCRGGDLCVRMRGFDHHPPSPPGADDASLRRDTLFYGVATGAERVVSFLLLPLLTKSLPQELYGVWSQVIVSAGLSSSVVLLGLHTAAVRFLAGRADTRDASAIAHGMLGIVLVTSLIAAALTVLFAVPLSRLVFGDVRFADFARWLGVVWAVEALFELTAGVLRARRAIRTVSVYYFVKNVMRVGALAVALLVLRLDLLRALVWMILLQLVLVGFVYGRDILKVVGWPRDVRDAPWKAILSFSLPLVPYSVLIWGNNFLDRYLLLHLLGIGQVSVYAVAYSLAAIGGLVYAVLGFVLYPYLADRWNQDDRRGAGEVLHRATQHYVTLLVPFVAMLTILGASITRVVATGAYLSSWSVLGLLGIGIGLFGFYQLNLYSTLLAGRMLANFGIVLVSIASNLALNVGLIPPLGLLGAAIATVVSNGILAFSTMALGRRSLPYVFPWRGLARVLLATVTMSLFLLAATSVLDVDRLWMLVLTVTLGVAIYVSVGGVHRALLIGRR